ncbi:hypothetical protein [Bradyrhizobium sp. USDA 4486]
MKTKRDHKQIIRLARCRHGEVFKDTLAEVLHDGAAMIGHNIDPCLPFGKLVSGLLDTPRGLGVSRQHWLALV